MHNAIHGTRITEHILAESKCISRSEASIPTSFHEPAASVAIPVDPAERSVIERDVPFIAIPCLLTRGAIARRRCGLAYIEGGASLFEWRRMVSTGDRRVGCHCPPVT